MTVTTQWLAILTSAGTLLAVLDLLRRRRLKERHAIWWLLAGFLALLISIFPQILSGLAAVIGIEIPINLVFFFSVVVLFLVCVQHSSELTALEEKVRTLAEKVTFLEIEIQVGQLAGKPGGQSDNPKEMNK